MLSILPTQPYQVFWHSPLPHNYAVEKEVQQEDKARLKAGVFEGVHYRVATGVVWTFLSVKAI